MTLSSKFLLHLKYFNFVHLFPFDLESSLQSLVLFLRLSLYRFHPNYVIQKVIASVWKLFNKCAYSWWGFFECVLQVALFTVLWFKWSVKKHHVAKILLPIWEKFLHENNLNYNSYRFNYKFAFILFFSFLTNKCAPIIIVSAIKFYLDTM